MSLPNIKQIHGFYICDINRLLFFIRSKDGSSLISKFIYLYIYFMFGMNNHVQSILH